MKPKPKLNEDQIEQLKTMVALNLPMQHCATILGIENKETLEAILNEDPEVKLAVELGRAIAQYNPRQTLYQMAMGGKRDEWIPVVDPKTGEETLKKVERWHPPNERMMQFWAKTQLNFKESVDVALTGPDGGPLNFIGELTVKQRKEKVELLKKQLDDTDDADEPQEA